jgi:putative MFS transporter
MRRTCAPPIGSQVLILAGFAYAIVQIVTFSLDLYSAEIYPTRMRAIGTGAGSAWLRLGSSAGPMLVGFVMSWMGAQYVFVTFAIIPLIGAVATMLFAVGDQG